MLVYLRYVRGRKEDEVFIKIEGRQA